MLPKYATGEKIPGTPYVVAYKIGRGGMGAVLAVRDEHLDVLRAIKLLDLEPRPGQKRADAVTEVLKEAVVIAKLHRLCREHIVEVLFVGQTADAHEVPYIVMELIDGAPLRDLLKRRGGKLEPIHARQVGVDVLAALAAAHDQGIVHRDLKPANIMCEMLDQNRVRMKVIDFGIVGGINQRTKRIAGTFRYAAPEQIHISGPSPLMAQTDIYSLGCILYECLAGEGPFDSYCKTNEHYVHAHLTATPPPISSLVPGIPRAFDAFFASILAKDVALRPASARACAAQLMDLPWDFSGEQDLTKTEEMLEAAIQSVVANHAANRGAPAASAQPTARSPGQPARNMAEQQQRPPQRQSVPPSATPRMGATLPLDIGTSPQNMSARGGTMRVEGMAASQPYDNTSYDPRNVPTRTSSPLVPQAGLPQAGVPSPGAPQRVYPLRPTPSNETDPLPEDYAASEPPAPAWGMRSSTSLPPQSNRDGDARDASTFGAVMRSFQFRSISTPARIFAIFAGVLGAAILCVTLGVWIAHRRAASETAAAAGSAMPTPVTASVNASATAAAAVAPLDSAIAAPAVSSAISAETAPSGVSTVAPSSSSAASATASATPSSSDHPTRAHASTRASETTPSTATIPAAPGTGATKPRKLPGSGL